MTEIKCPSCGFALLSDEKKTQDISEIRRYEVMDFIRLLERKKWLMNELHLNDDKTKKYLKRMGDAGWVFASQKDV